MAKQIMIRDDIAAELDKIRKERSCSYSTVIDELLSEREKNAPERAKDFFAAAAAFEDSVDEYNEYTMEERATIGPFSARILKNEKAMSGIRKAIKNYLICADLFGYLTKKDASERTKEISDFLIYELCFFYDCEKFTNGSPQFIFSPSMIERVKITEEAITEEAITEEVDSKHE